jgi:hypothetical protein
LSLLFLSTKEDLKYLFLEYHNLNPLTGQDIHEVSKTLGDIAAGCGLGEEKASEALEMMRT